MTIALKTTKLGLRMGKKTLCHGLEIEMQPGQRWALLGPNGSGKTTFLHALAGLHSPTNGQIFLGEENISQLPPLKIAQSMGLLFQEWTDFFPQTVWEYCLASRYSQLNYLKKYTSHDQAVAKKSLQIMELEDFSQKNIQHLSGGERRRLAIAALLTQAPMIFLLDEPTNHLDIRHQLLALQHFTQLAKTQSATVIMSLHDINLAERFCTHALLFFPDGTLQGTIADVLIEANLTRLYQHPLKKIHIENKFVWY